MYFVVEIVVKVAPVTETYLRVFQNKEDAEEQYIDANAQAGWYAIPPVEVHELTFN